MLVILLLSNVELSAIGRKRFSTLAQALGDPIDIIWSLVHKLQTWNRIYYVSRKKVCGDRCGLVSRVKIRISLIWRLLIGIIRRVWDRLRNNTRPLDVSLFEEEEARVRVVATVLAGFEEIVGPEIATDEFFDTVMDKFGALDNREQFWRQTALELADGRTNEFLRTALAIALYMLQVTSAFMKEVGGEPQTPPGGVIACALFLSHLVPIAYLSNCIGAVTSRRSCLAIISRFVDAAAPTDITYRIGCTDLGGGLLWRDYFNELQ